MTDFIKLDNGRYEPVVKKYEIFGTNLKTGESKWFEFDTKEEWEEFKNRQNDKYLSWAFDYDSINLLF